MLACELTKACSDQPCQLPRGVTSVARQGVTWTLAALSQFLLEGQTGLFEVDLFLSSPWTSPPAVVAFASEDC